MIGSISTRQLIGADNYDVVCLKVDSNDFVGKTGIIEIDITSITFGGATGTGGIIDVRVPNFDPDHDTAVVNAYNLTTWQGSVPTPLPKYFIAVNNGVFGPSTRLQLDDTVDLLQMVVNAPAGTATPGWQATLNYVYTFTDKTPSTTPAVGSGNGTMTLRLRPADQMISGDIGDLISNLGSQSGWVFFQFMNLLTTSVLKQSDVNFPPFFTMQNQLGAIYGHYLTQFSGRKIYPPTSCYLYAVNQGIPDANAQNKYIGGSFAAYLSTLLARVDGRIGTADITVQLEYLKSSGLA